MPIQSQGPAQFVFGSANGGDTLHYTDANNNISTWVDKNGMIGGVSGIRTAAQNGGASAPITASTGGVFSYTGSGVQTFVNLPGGGAYEQLPFTVKAYGFVSLPAGTYTATVQPLIYGSTSAGFTASAAAAILSAAAANVTVASATAATSYPWKAEVSLFGDSTSGKVNGSVSGIFGTGTTAPVALAVPVNTPTGVNFANAVPLQFLAGVTTSNGGAGTVVELGSLVLSS